MTVLSRRIWQYLRQPWRLAVLLKRLLVFAVVGLAVCATAVLITRYAGLARTWIIAFIVFWLAIAYYILPRVHRLLSSIYVPNYFIGRARTADGLLADPVNLALRGTEKTLRKVMHKAGWTEADPLSLQSAFRIVQATLQRKSYGSAPVSDMYVFGRKQDFAFQREVDGNPAKRHHIRFWYVPKEIFLPGGYDVDAERDFVVETIKKAHRARSIQKIEGFFPGYQHRNGGGDKFFTDGSMVIVDLKKGLLK